MQNLFKWASLFLFFALLAISPAVSVAQTPGGINTSTPPTTGTAEEEDSEATEEATIEDTGDGPVDDVVKKRNYVRTQSIGIPAYT